MSGEKKVGSDVLLGRSGLQAETHVCECGQGGYDAAGFVYYHALDCPRRPPDFLAALEESLRRDRPKGDPDA